MLMDSKKNPNNNNNENQKEKTLSVEFISTEKGFFFLVSLFAPFYTFALCLCVKIYLLSLLVSNFR